MASTLFGRTKLAGSMLLEVPVEPPEPVPDPDPEPDPEPDPDPEPADEPEPVEPTEDEDPPPPPPPQEARIKNVVIRNVDPNLFINFSLYHIDNTT